MTDARLTYDAVGDTDPLVSPARFRPLERSSLIGHGADDFALAVDRAMRWEIQSRSGMRVRAGDEILEVGDEVVLCIPVGPIRVNAYARVVYVIEEPRRGGFAYGTLPGHPESGEEAFIVEHRDDDSVWLVIRAFSRPANWFWWLGAPFLRIAQEFYTRRYLRVLRGS